MTHTISFKVQVGDIITIKADVIALKFADGLYRADPGHGQRAAEFVRTLQGSLLTLPAEDLELLVYACQHHSQDITDMCDVLVCYLYVKLRIWKVGWLDGWEIGKLVSW